MNLSILVKNSIKYPFRNIKKLPIICILFILISIIPIGMVSDNDYVVAVGVIAFFLFVLIVPGYFLSVVKLGTHQSSILPSFNLINDIYDSIRVLLLRMVYMIVPVAVFFVSLNAFGPASREMIYNLRIHEFIATVGFVLLVIIITYLIFEFLLFFAKARLAYFNSLKEALKINEVINDIKNIGIANIGKWLIVMAVLLNAATFVSSFVIAIPYVGWLIYICVVIPILESVANYSLGLLYSNITRSYGDLRVSESENQIESIKYELK
jgi:hypothetical protein